MCTNVFTHKHTELPTSSRCCKQLRCTGPLQLRNHTTIEQHVRGGKLPVGICPLDCNNYENIVSFLKMLTRTALTIWEVGKGGGEGEGGYGGKMS